MKLKLAKINKTHHAACTAEVLRRRVPLFKHKRENTRDKEELTSEVAMKRLKQFAILYEMAWELKRAAFQKKYPQLEDIEINKLTAKVFMMAKT